MADRGDAQIPQVISREARQEIPTDGILSERRRILLKT